MRVSPQLSQEKETDLEPSSCLWSLGKGRSESGDQALSKSCICKGLSKGSKQGFSKLGFTTK